MPTIYYLTLGDDYFVGTPDSDEVHGLAGNDVIFGYDSPNWISGQPFPPDRLFGDAGRDYLYLNHSPDHYDAFGYAYGGDGNDTMIATGPGQFSMSGGNGNDTLICLHGISYLHGDAGDDTIIEGGDAAHMDGGWGNDHLIFRNERTNDDLVMGYGASMTGGRGADIFEIHIDQAGSAYVAVTDFHPAEGDKLWITLDDGSGHILVPVKALEVMLDRDGNHSINLADGMSAPDFGVTATNAYSLDIHLGGANLVHLGTTHWDFHL